MALHLRRRGVIGAVSSAVVGAVAASAALAAAQVPNELPIGVDPDSGPPGTAITVSGDGCTGSEVALVLLGEDTLDLESATPDAETGAWSGTLTVPDDDGLAGAGLDITADCLGGDAVYATGSFSVDPAVPPTTDPPATTEPPTTEPEPPGPGPDTPTGPPMGPPAPGQPGAPAEPEITETPVPAPPRPEMGRPNFAG